MNLEKQPTNTREQLFFVGGTAKTLREIEEKVGRVQYDLAKFGDLVHLYETALKQIAAAKSFDNIGNWARNLAKETLKQASK